MGIRNSEVLVGGQDIGHRREGEHLLEKNKEKKTKKLAFIYFVVFMSGSSSSKHANKCFSASPLPIGIFRTNPFFVGNVLKR